MAKFRLIHTSFWNDPKVVEELTPEDKYFFLYLLTNEKTSQIGIYQITKKQMAFDLGYSNESINALMQRFIEHHKLIKYSTETREIAIKNWGRYNLTRGGKPVLDCVISELKHVKDTSLITWVGNGVTNDSIKKLFDSYHDTYNDTLTTSVQEKEKEKEEEKEEKEEKEEVKKSAAKAAGSSLPYDEIIDYLNQKAGTNYKSSSKATRTLIKARFDEGFKTEDFKTVIDKKIITWLQDPHFNQYLRPSTLFQASKFEGYLNERVRGYESNQSSSTKEYRDGINF
ncbi:conserved phage C-terminal domain-containing protein [Rummeliibacillus sp. NPDC094406]|uniref:conserved phage C-terminal domain-containing protein n=1 Tax=Rummeliibacillus sp. NPDC094406 TaxID=3364511 RepID=UPI0037FC7A1F